jgi:hypothetical protein
VNVFGFLHRERAHRQLRREHAELLAAHEELKFEHGLAVGACAYFKGRYEEEYERAEAVETRAAKAEKVVACLEDQLTEERQKVAALEQIAGPYVPADGADSPIFTEVTSETPLPDFTGTPIGLVYPDSVDTLALPVVRTLADAHGART